jgi:hypothetical protein
MGQLINKDDIHNADWYFEDAYYSTEGRRYVYSWPNNSYLYSVSIHADDLNRTGKKPLLRRWIELNLQETVIFSRVDNTYHKYYGTNHSWENSYEKVNQWFVFYFENEHSATLFRLAFSELVKTITKHHPDSPEDEAWCNATPGERALLR